MRIFQFRYMHCNEAVQCNDIIFSFVETNCKNSSELYDYSHIANVNDLYPINVSFRQVV